VEELEAADGFEAGVDEARGVERSEVVGGEERLALDAGAVEDALDVPLEFGEVDQEVGPANVARFVVAVGAGFFEEGDELVGEAVERVAAGGVLLEVVEGELVEGLAADGAGEDGEALAQAVEQAGLIGDGVD
jgi:hypothetical protein